MSSDSSLSVSDKNKRRPGGKWNIDFTAGKGSDMSALVAPVGFVRGSSDHSSTKDPSQNLITKRSWEIALGPIKQVPMNLFIMWMAGNTISIFPIMMVGMMLFRPVQAILQIQQTYKMIQGDNSFLQKLTYLVGNLVVIVLAVYKCQTMGLLPTHASDWLAFLEHPMRMEWVGGGLLL